jgi:hypothetical protein
MECLPAQKLIWLSKLWRILYKNNKFINLLRSDKLLNEKRSNKMVCEYPIGG